MMLQPDKLATQMFTCEQTIATDHQYILFFLDERSKSKLFNYSKAKGFD